MDPKGLSKGVTISVTSRFYRLYRTSFSFSIPLWWSLDLECSLRLIQLLFCGTPRLIFHGFSGHLCGLPSCPEWCDQQICSGHLCQDLPVSVSWQQPFQWEECVCDPTEDGIMTTIKVILWPSLSGLSEPSASPIQLPPMASCWIYKLELYLDYMKVSLVDPSKGNIDTYLLIYCTWSPFALSTQRNLHRTFQNNKRWIWCLSILVLYIHRTLVFSMVIHIPCFLSCK